MSGCTNCKGKAGCDDQKGDMFADLNAALAALYPTKTWGQWQRDQVSGPLDAESLHGLATELGQELNAAVFVQQNAPSDLPDAPHCDYIYILCIGRAPAIAAWAVPGDGAHYKIDAPAAFVANMPSDEPVSEMYLRLAISHFAPLAAVQQLAIGARLTDDEWGQGVWISQLTRSGVFDAPLLPRMQKLVTLLPAYGLRHLDFGEISAALPDYNAGAWADMYSGAPCTANYLFFPEPVTLASEWFAPLEGHAPGIFL